MFKRSFHIIYSILILSKYYHKINVFHQFIFFFGQLHEKSTSIYDVDWNCGMYNPMQDLLLCRRFNFSYPLLLVFSFKISQSFGSYEHFSQLIPLSASFLFVIHYRFFGGSELFSLYIRLSSGIDISKGMILPPNLISPVPAGLFVT